MNFADDSLFFVFFDARRNSSLFAVCVLSVTLLLLEGKLSTFSEKVRRRPEAADEPGKYVKLADLGRSGCVVGLCSVGVAGISEWMGERACTGSLTGGTASISSSVVMLID